MPVTVHCHLRGSPAGAGPSVGLHAQPDGQRSLVSAAYGTAQRLPTANPGPSRGPTTDQTPPPGGLVRRTTPIHRFDPRVPRSSVAIRDVDPKLNSLASILDRADSRLRSPDSSVRIWPTGFPLLDDALGGGLRAGALNVLAGPQGQGKTTMSLQIARNAVAAGRAAIFLSFELDAEALLQRLIALEAGIIGGINATGMARVRAAFEGSDGGVGGLPERLAGTAGID